MSKKHILVVVNWEESLFDDIRFSSLDELKDYLKFDEGVYDSLLECGEAEIEEFFSFKLLHII